MLKNNILNTSVGLIALATLTVCASAEITSRACPHSCKTMGLSKRHCKDWKEGNTCYVQDLGTASHHNSGNTQENLSRKIVMVNKSIMAGKVERIKVPGDVSIAQFDVVVRREGGSSETALKASIDSDVDLGTQQVDHNTNHVLRFDANGLTARKRKLELRAQNGDIFVESVHVLSR